MLATRPSGALRLPFVPLLSALLLALVSPLAAADETGEAAAPRVRLATTLGDIVVELDRRRAPVTVENFLRYVEDDFYDDTIFHRVIEGFMIQGGGFTDDFARKRTRAPIVNEANNGLSNRRHTVAMARTNAPHSATAQFFINTVDNPNLDHSSPTPRGWGYTVFGRVVEGQETVDRIAAVATGPGGPFSRDAPREPVVILEAVPLPPPGTDVTAGDDTPSPTAAEPVVTPTPDEPSTDDASGEPRGARTASEATELAG